MDGRPGLQSGDEAREDTDIESTKIKANSMLFFN